MRPELQTTTTNHYGGLRLSKYNCNFTQILASMGHNYTNTCFDLLIRLLLQGGTKGLNAG